MLEKVQKHLWYYLTFLTIQLSGVAAVYFFAYDEFLQMVIVCLMILFYVFWSTVHHAIHHDLTRKIFLEYVLVGSLGGVVVFFLLFTS